MGKRIPVLVAALMLAATAGTVFAKGGAGGGMGGGMGGGAMGGDSGQHLSTQGMQNSNGPNSLDRDKGRQRAEDRRNAKAQDHSRSGQSQSEGKRRSGAPGEGR